MLIIDNNEFLQKQLDLRLSKLNGEEIEWQDIADFRANARQKPIEHRDTIRKGSFLLDEYIEAGWVANPDNNKQDIPVSSRQTTIINADKSETSESQFFIEDESKLRDYDYLLKLHNYDPAKFEIISAKNSKWNNASGEKTLYSSKITVKPKKEVITFDMISEWFKTLKSPPTPKRTYVDSYGKGENLLTIPLVDLHFNMLATAFVTGNEYNCEIAKNNFFQIINESISRCKDKKIAKILFPIGNDLFNANGISGTTFKGTPQQEDKHIFDAYVQLFSIVTQGIKMLADLAPVDVVFVPSNHDKEVAFYFMHTLSVEFKNDKDVNTDFSPLPRKYYKFGNTLFVFSHDMKLDVIARTILDDGKNYLDGIEYIEVMLAHLHSETVKQDGNITIRRLPTSSGKSAWCNDSGYSSKKVHQSFVFNDKTSISDILYITV